MKKGMYSAFGLITALSTLATAALLGTPNTTQAASKIQTDISRCWPLKHCGTPNTIHTDVSRCWPAKKCTSSTPTLTVTSAGTIHTNVSRCWPVKKCS